MTGRRHALIRGATAASHAALDAAVTRAGYFDSATGYVELLRGLHAFHVELDASAGPRLKLGLAEWSIGPRASWLLQDLDELQTPPRAGAPGSSRQLPDSSDACLGVVYVLLGATLGARILVDRARLLLRELEPKGLTYISQLASCRDWPRFLSHLETCECADETAIARAATGIFERIRDHVGREVVA